ncbi:MAG: ribosome biogenesis GTPase Der [Chloroflexota bacterium]|nr:ribosome biogenesis GTPase Der [Chloroflexota bacterium]
MPKPVVAIVGRPNVGKSSLFNRIVGRREAIVADEPGTTRDRVVAEVTWEGRSFVLMDTGGLEPHPQDPLRHLVKEQVELAAEEADVIIFLLDAVDGVAPMDEEIADWLRRKDKRLVVAANKVDNLARSLSAADTYRLGLGEPFFVSAYHNTGIYDLLDQVTKLLPEAEPEPPAQEGLARLAIIGRPNVGKSLLLNTILGQPRSIVSEEPGTTRDAIDTRFTYKGQSLALVDTAGIRRRGSVQPGVEHYSVLRAFQAIERADVVLLVMDATELATGQDSHIAGLAWEAHRGVVLVVNKWDLAAERNLNPEEATAQIRRVLHFMSYAPIRFTSALLDQGVSEALETALALHQERSRRVPNDELQRVVRQVMAEHPPVSQRGRHLDIKRIAQEGINPPLFVFVVNDPLLVHFSYQRYLENSLREAFRFNHTHLRLVFRKMEGAR